MPACLQELVDRVRSGGGQPGGSAGGSPTGGDFENLAWFGARLGRRPGVDELRDVSSLLGVLGVDVLSLTSYTTSAHSYHFIAFQLGDSSSDQLGGHRKSTEPARIELA